MDVAKLNQEILGVDLEYKNVYIDAENTRMIRAKPEFWSSDWRNSGLYICENGSYHRLLYTPNKGYVRHGEPDVDEDFTLDIGEKSFNSYVMTLSQSWYKLGNVHAGIGFLKEKE